MTRPIPEGLHTVTPSLTIEGAAEAIEFYKKAFGAVEVDRHTDPDGNKIMHASFRIGDSTIFINDAFPQMGAMPGKASLWIYTAEVDAFWKRATEAGGKVTMPLADQFWGDRVGALEDRWGIRWTLAQRIKEMTKEQLAEAQKEFTAQMEKAQPKK